MWAIGIMMYQLMSQGEHPMYKKGEDSYYDYLNKLKKIAKNDSSDKS
jgi:hypothetical protein